MKLIIQNTRIAATATDDYTGPDEYIQAPPDFNAERMGEYRVVDGVLTLTPSIRITKLAFRNRFTGPEKVAIEFAGLDDPAAPMAQRLQAAALRSNQADVNAATFIDLAREDTRAGVQMLEALGLLAEGRVLEILDAPVQPEERPAS